MRKLLVLLVILFFCVNSFAGIIFSPEINPDGSATVTWTSDVGIAGMALECTVTSGGEGLVVTMNDFNVFIDEAYDVVIGGGDIEELPVGINPIANPDFPGIGNPEGTFSICGGYLSPDNQGLFTGTIDFDADEYTTIDITADETRGGVVSMGGDPFTFAPFEVVILPEPATIGLLSVGGLVIARSRWGKLTQP